MKSVILCYNKCVEFVVPIRKFDNNKKIKAPYGAFILLFSIMFYSFYQNQGQLYNTSLLFSS